MLEFLDVSSNSLRGETFKNIGVSKLSHVDISNNSLKVVNMSNLPYVEYFDLSSCQLGPRFPKWIQTLKNLTHLNIANAGISDTIPIEFWNMWASRLNYLNLSSNNITGKVPDLLSNFDRDISRIDLSYNNFSGRIPIIPSSLEALNLSRNKFYGGISFLCQLVDVLLIYLDLSNNALTGQIPDCLWHLKNLKVLNLGNNNLSGWLPASVEYLIELEVLYLYKNNFSGELPLSLQNCIKISFLDLGENKFSGNVPLWIGENLPRLYVLSLRSNKFFGTIPLQLCQLVNLQVLDLSMNNLYGTIPSCVNNLTTMVQEGSSLERNVHYYFSDTTMSPSIYTNFSTYYLNFMYSDRAMIEWQGNVHEFSSNLGLLKSIDLSSNNLTGTIPYELTKLYGLLALDLSHNSLLGEIPQNIGQMKQLVTLNLSRNKFSGHIPSSMSKMTLLNYLDLSYNNLSGRIPFGTQLQSFEPSRYTGNAGLCGLPVTIYCPGDEELQVPPSVDVSKGGGEGVHELQRWFNIGMATGFPIGFWIVCSTLLLYRPGRHAFFNFLDNLKDWVYVKVVTSRAKLQRVARP